MIEDYLKMVAQIRGEHSPLGPDHYPCVEAMLLDQGTRYTRVAPPDDVPHRGPMRECFRNAVDLAAVDRGMTYVEGFARSGSLFPMHHAWCVDSAGVVHDPTWETGVEYLGIPFSTSEVMSRLSRAKVYGLLDMMNPANHDLLRRSAMKTTAEADRGGVMLALVPSKAATQRLMEASGATEPEDEQHITLAYFGTLGEEIPDDERTRDTVYNHALGAAALFAPMNGAVSGWGIFNNEQDTLVALWSIPGVNGLRQHLVHELSLVGIAAKNNYSFNPHQTMSYADPGSLKMPQRLDPRVESDFRVLVLSWGQEWIEIPLTGFRVEARDYTRGGNPDNPGQFSSQDRGHRKKDRKSEDSKPTTRSTPGGGSGASSTPSGGSGTTQRSQDTSQPAGRSTSKSGVPLGKKTVTGAPDMTETLAHLGLKPNLKPTFADGEHTAPSYETAADKESLTEVERAQYGDQYGKFLPKGKYLEGDPRNEPEFERVLAEKEALSNHYVSGAAPLNVAESNDAEWFDPANQEEINRWRENGEGGQTSDLYDRLTPKAGTKGKVWSPERRKVHQKILRDMQQQYKGYPREGKCIVMAGPPGAGKSTALKKFGKETFGLEVTQDKSDPRPAQNYVTINPDDFKDFIPVDEERYPGLEPNELASIKHEESSFLAEMATQYFMSRGYNVVIDITLGKESSAARKYYDPYAEDYDYQVLLVDGDMANSRNNAGLRYKAPDKKTGKRTYSGRFLTMDLIESNAPRSGQWRSKNAEEFHKFIKRDRVSASYVFDPYAPDKGMQPATAAIHAKASLSGKIRVKKEAQMSGFQTTEITEKIEAFGAGQVTEAELIEFLTTHDYSGGEKCPHQPGTPEWWDWWEGNGYQAGTFDEVLLARNSGRLSWDVFNKVNDALATGSLPE